MYNTFFQDELDVLKNNGHYRVFNALRRDDKNIAHATLIKNGTEKKVSVWCSNDYLGMSHNQEIINCTIDTIKIHGVGSGGTRNISGTSILHEKLEEEVALLHNKEAGLLFSSGYVANEATLSTLGKNLKDCVFFCDEKNHASMIQGVKHSMATKYVFCHNNLDQLEDFLKLYPLNRPKIIAFVSLYSMDGDFAPIAKIVKLAKKYNALTYLDEVHAVGIYGKNGAGLAEQLELSDSIDIIQANFAKSYGIIGGYITGNKNVIDYIRSKASGFIFTTSLPPSIVQAAITSINFIKNDTSLRKKLFENVNYLKNQLEKTKINYLKNQSHIIPIVIGDAKLCKQMSDELIDKYSIYTQAINYPTVPINTERFRITVTPFHNKKDCDYFIDSLNELWNKTFNNTKVA